jgi:CHAT domain-containing protein
LFDGKAHVVERNEVVYGASASVLRICRSKEATDATEDLVLAVPDESTPAIRDEAEALAELLPNARVFIGAEARSDLLRQYGSRVRRLHIAAHGVFRSDNPMFSSLRLGDSWLNLMDIFNLKLGADLTTLSACETGMSALYEGDELLGLTRGFLYAGTPSLVVSLWRVNDSSTTLLMRTFYEGMLAGRSKPRAIQQAMLRVKQDYPHPYYWAPFVLMGKS